MKAKRKSDFGKVAHLIPLRVTDDLNVEDAKNVDEAVRYDDNCRAALDSYTQAISVLHDAASQPVPHESLIVRGEGGSLWDRIEPQLGPAGKMRPNGLDWLPTRYLAAACIALVVVTAASETGKMTPFGATPNVRNVVLPVATNTQDSAPQPGQRVQVQIPVPAEFVRFLMGERMDIPEAGIAVVRIDRIIQKQLHLPDLNGVVVVHVQEGSPGSQAGLQLGDCIVGLNGHSVYAPRHLRELLADSVQEGTLRFELIRHRKSNDAGQNAQPTNTPSAAPTGFEPNLIPTMPGLNAPNWMPNEVFTGSIIPA